VALTPQTSFAPFTTIARPDGENLGYVVEPDNPNAVLPTAQATPSASLAFYLPSGGSSALGEGDPETNQSLSKYVLRDFSGELRPMNASVGAFEN